MACARSHGARFSDSRLGTSPDRAPGNPTAQVVGKKQRAEEPADLISAPCCHDGKEPAASCLTQCDSGAPRPGDPVAPVASALMCMLSSRCRLVFAGAAQKQGILHAGGQDRPCLRTRTPLAGLG